MPNKLFDYVTDGFLAITLSIVMDVQFIKECFLVVLAVVVKYCLQMFFDRVKRKVKANNEHETNNAAHS